jgi:peptidoglycan/xylan/chitin deacetylase (PgdA/CDA1 family)
LLKKYNLESTWFCPGLSIESFPETVRDIFSSGHEIGAHGYSHEDPRKLSVEQEKGVFNKSIELIKDVTGSSPKGFVAPYWEMTEQTSKLLLKFGFRYDHSQFHRDFEPYFMRIRERWSKIDYGKPSEEWMKPLDKGKTVDIVEIPASWYLDDITPLMFIKNFSNTFGFIPASEVMAMWYSQFQWMLKSVESEFRVFTITLHPDASGRSHVITELDKLIARITSVPKVINLNFYEFSEIFRKVSRNNSGDSK